MNNIPPFSQGPQAAVTKLNRIIEELRSLSNIQGDGLVKVQKNNIGCVIGLNLNVLRQRLFHQKFKTDGGGDSYFSRYKIITSPILPTPEDPSGQAYYTLRLSSQSYDTWSDSYVGGYALNAYVLHPETNRLYKSLKDDNEDALTVAESWSLQQEIRVTKTLQYPAESIFNFVPILPVDGEVWVFKIDSEDSGGGFDYYILETFNFVGEPETRTLTMITDDNDDYVMAAVFA